MIETLWVLEKSYSISGLDAKKTVSSLLACPEFSFSTRNPLAGWSEIMTSSHPDITDLVIAGVNTELGCTLTYTFDRRAARNVPGMVLLT